MHAAVQPFTPPRPDQWIYIEIKQTLANKIADSKGTSAEKTIQYWKRADGLKEAMVLDGALIVLDQVPGSEMPPWDYPTLAGLPTDPHALLTWVQSKVAGDSWSFMVIASMVAQNVLPPDVTASALRAAALIPGVTETPEPTNIDGRSVTALGRVIDDWRQMDILLDFDTHAVIGIRDIAVANYRDPGGHFEFNNGEFIDMVILKAGRIVDAPGQTS